MDPYKHSLIDKTTNVGFKQPPANKRFAKGHSGNPQGRPKGAPNEADILQRLLNLKVVVNESGGRHGVPLCAAIIRQTVARATSGDTRALQIVNWIRDKFGSTDVTSEERQRRTFRMTRSFTRNEYDFTGAPGREKERQYCHAVIDRESLALQGNRRPSPIEVGDKFADQNKINEALTAYCQQIHDLDSSLKLEPDNKFALSRHPLTVARVGLLADKALLTGDFAAAVKCADVAIECSLGVNLTWVELIRAHAIMLIGKSDAAKTDQARTFYLHFKSEKREIFTNWETAILRDFYQLRKAGHSCALMTEIEQKLAAEGWTVCGQLRTAKAPVPGMTNEERQFCLLNPNDVKTGTILARYADLDGAKPIFESTIAECQAKLANDPQDEKSAKKAKTAAMFLGGLARKFIEIGRFPMALECSDRLVQFMAELPHLQAMRAHALMFAGHDQEALALYRNGLGKLVWSTPWQTAIAEQFDGFRKKGLGRAWMTEVEDMLSVQPEQAPPDTNEIQ